MVCPPDGKTTRFVAQARESGILSSVCPERILKEREKNLRNGRKRKKKGEVEILEHPSATFSEAGKNRDRIINRRASHVITPTKLFVLGFISFYFARSKDRCLSIRLFKNEWKK